MVGASDIVLKKRSKESGFLLAADDDDIARNRHGKRDDRSRRQPVMARRFRVRHHAGPGNRTQSEEQYETADSYEFHGFLLPESFPALAGVVE
ncbi:MAG: hypothetical protein A2663_03040 [Candidatus Buchananbacteria bacterium RIFCSPHIGHO2_01_FULL_46_12]|uniref:Uncharacterized protein n=2 Tax=Candidatus Buchananiibacteriota TaxID=1817903 RepID=A0A1G1Y9H2_9BACT|nr:MAG: hypothetical protein A2663_03040 [Candidatus Buchananbacteria bacterium RIFCSPHIGHO2_01_FULL_46_12]OGY53538.1 MAG: hypothetical protein A3B15_03090 [Candidatus Buchananbacteria bacterium RIFCSPLOWO2_01_FULL_45_31]